MVRSKSFESENKELSPWYRGLNEDQQKAVAHNYGPMLILAGAGSGKTTTLVSRTGRLIDEKIARPENICVLTFTNKASRELKHRVETRLRDDIKLWTGTFHSFGVRILREYFKEANLPKYFGIMDQQDSNGLIREILKDFKFYNKDKFDTEILLSNMARWREKGQKKSITDLEYDVVTEWLLPQYQKKKELLGVVDFDDLVLKPLELFKEHPKTIEGEKAQWHQIMVDEFQDTNVAQMNLIHALTQGNPNLTVVGDDDQSIYGWRGAQVQNILNFPKRYKETFVVRLEKNYRSTKEILDLANNVISKNDKRYGKNLFNPNGKTGTHSLTTKPEVFRFETDVEEIDGVAREIQILKDQGYSYNDVAILFRANSQGGFLEATLKENKIPYKISGGMSFLERKEIKDTHAYLKCAFRLSDIDFRRILNVPSRGIGETSIEKIAESAKILNSTFVQSSKNWMNLGVQPKAGQAIDSLFLIFKKLKEDLLRSPLLPSVVLQKTLEELGYRSHLVATSKDSVVAQKKWSLVEVYLRLIDRFIEKHGRNLSSFQNFILSLELKDDDKEDKKGDEVQLMTLHSCKGLEFPCVILIGVEEDFLPHKSLGSDITEERRLFYVGLTRAKERLILTYCQKRQLGGRWVNRLASRFLEEADKNLYTIFQEGLRPETRENRKKMLSDFINSL